MSPQIPESSANERVPFRKGGEGCVREVSEHAYLLLRGIFHLGSILNTAYQD